MPTKQKMIEDLEAVNRELLKKRQVTTAAQVSPVPAKAIEHDGNTEYMGDDLDFIKHISAAMCRGLKPVDPASTKRDELVRGVQRTILKVKMFLFISSVQARIADLDYQFAIKRFPAPRVDRDERLAVLDALIHDGVMAFYKKAGTTCLRIDPDSEATTRFWAGVDSLREKCRTWLQLNS